MLNPCRESVKVITTSTFSRRFDHANLLNNKYLLTFNEDDNKIRGLMLKCLALTPQKTLTVTNYNYEFNQKTTFPICVFHTQLSVFAKWIFERNIEGRIKSPDRKCDGESARDKNSDHHRFYRCV